MLCNHINTCFISLFVTVFSGLISTAMAQNKPCQFDQKTLQFAGSPVAQARCLLRPNKIRGVLSEELIKLPEPLEIRLSSAG